MRLNVDVGEGKVRCYGECEWGYGQPYGDMHGYGRAGRLVRWLEQR